MILCEINIKLVFHEIPWKKDFAVYPSVKKIINKDTLFPYGTWLKDFHSKAVKRGLPLFEEGFPVIWTLNMAPVYSPDCQD